MNPLASIAEHIADARTLPPVKPHTPSADPLSQLAAFVRGDASAAQPTPDVAKPSSTSSSSSSQAARLGDAVLDIVANRPLSPDARLEAVQRCLVAIENPNASNVRAILESLISSH